MKAFRVVIVSMVLSAPLLTFVIGCTKKADIRQDTRTEQRTEDRMEKRRD